MNICRIAVTKWLQESIKMLFILGKLFNTYNRGDSVSTRTKDLLISCRNTSLFTKLDSRMKKVNLLKIKVLQASNFCFYLRNYLKICILLLKDDSLTFRFFPSAILKRKYIDEDNEDMETSWQCVQISELHHEKLLKEVDIVKGSICI